LGCLLMQCSSPNEERKGADNLVPVKENVVYQQKETSRVSDDDPTSNHLDDLKVKYENRKTDFFKLHKSEEIDNIHAALVQLFINDKPLDDGFINAINKINKREDCADFRLIGLIRFIYQFRDTPLVPISLQDSIQQTILNFKYWPDEPGIDNMCTWSENHHILFSTCEYLAGHYYRDSVFSNSGHTGFEKYEYLSL